MGTGVELNVLEMTQYDFMNVGLGATVTMMVAQNIDVSRYDEPTLSARLHEATVTGSGTSPSVSFDVISVAPVAQDPSKFFTGSSKATATIITAGAPSTPLVVQGSNSAAFGSVVSVRMTVTNWGTTSTALKFTVSLSLTLKS